MKRTQTVTFTAADWSPASGFNWRYSVAYTLVDSEFVGTPQEEAHQTTGGVVVIISGRLYRAWNLDEDDLAKVLFEIARQHVENGVFKGSLWDYEEIMLTTYSTEPQPPHDPTSIQIELNKPLRFPVR